MLDSELNEKEMGRLAGLLVKNADSWTSDGYQGNDFPGEGVARRPKKPLLPFPNKKLIPITQNTVSFQPRKLVKAA